MQMTFMVSGLIRQINPCADVALPGPQQKDLWTMTQVTNPLVSGIPQYAQG